MITVPCPRCGMPVGLEEEICPHCRAPRDDMELEEGRALVRKEELRLKRRPKLIAGGVAALVVLSLAWLLRDHITAPLGVAWRDFQIEVEKTRQPGHWIKVNAAEPTVIINTSPAAFPAPAAFAGPQDQPYIAETKDATAAAAMAAIPPPPDPPSAGPTEIVAAAAPAPPPPDQSVRCWYGVVYDLVTLKPIANAKVMFQAKSDTLGWGTTDAAGHYRIDLNKSAETGQVSVSIANPPGYREGLLEDRDPPLRERSRDARRMIMDETTDNDLEPVPLRYKVSAQVVELDLVLVPLAEK